MKVSSPSHRWFRKTDAKVNQPENLQPGLNQPPEKPTQQGEQQAPQQNLPVQQNTTPVHSVAG